MKKHGHTVLAIAIIVANRLQFNFFYFLFFSTQPHKLQGHKLQVFKYLSCLNEGYLILSYFSSNKACG